MANQFTVNKKAEVLTSVFLLSLYNLTKDGRTVISSLTSVSRSTANGAPLV